MERFQGADIFKTCQQSVNAWVNLLCRMAENTERAARAGYDISRQAIKGEKVDTDAYMNSLDNMYEGFNQDLKKMAENLPFAGWEPIQEPSRRFLDARIDQQYKEQCKQWIEFQARALRHMADWAREGASFFVNPKELDQAIREIDQQCAENWDCARDVLHGWLNFARENAKKLAEEPPAAAPFQIFNPDMFKSEEKSSKTTAPDSQAA